MVAKKREIPPMRKKNRNDGKRRPEKKGQGEGSQKNAGENPARETEIK